MLSDEYVFGSVYVSFFKMYLFVFRKWLIVLTFLQFFFFHIGGYEGDKVICNNAFGWKSVGQELRPNDLTTDLPRFQHGNRALASKDMKKSQGKLGHIRIHC